MKNGKREGEISQRESRDCSVPPRCPHPLVSTRTYTWKPSLTPWTGLGNRLSPCSPSPTARKTESSKWLWLLKPGSLAGLRLPSSGQQHGEQSAAKLPKLDYQRSRVSVPSWPADCGMLGMGRWAASPRADLQSASEEEERGGRDGPCTAYPPEPCSLSLAPLACSHLGHFL